ncbi:hypothetical protein ACA910_022284 [Epithemia clementina (nom. ined.)]
MTTESEPKPSVKSSEGGCPVRHSGMASQSRPWSWLGKRASSKPDAAGASLYDGPSSFSSSSSSSSSSCSAAAASIEEAAKHAQTPQPDQRVKLDTNRQVSSIPRGEGESSTPHHQHRESHTRWVYPSEQQLYNAMRKKGWTNIPEESVPIVLQIHNAVNEGTWQKICQWEGTDRIRLVKFEGRQQDLTPKAFLFSKVLGWNPMPFDRHDWYVSNSSGMNNTEKAAAMPLLQRYVIDYYMMDQADTRLPPLTRIDVRPALDNFRGAYLHGRRFLQLSFPGITTYLRRLQQQQKIAIQEQQAYTTKLHENLTRDAAASQSSKN